MSNLAGKYALVTGAAKGIGRAVAKKFLDNEVAGVALWDMDEELLKKTAQELDPEGNRTLVVPCNVANQEQVKAAAAKTLEKFGRVDVLINNAGITRDALFHKMSVEQWDQVINVNLNSIFYVCKEIVPVMRENEYGKIVSLSSTSAAGNIGQANYSATKAAIKGLTYTLAKELGPKNICVNALAPAFIETDMMLAVPEELQEKWKKEIPLRRFAPVEEVANVIYFFSTDDSSFVTGQCITVAGGWANKTC